MSNKYHFDDKTESGNQRRKSSSTRSGSQHRHQEPFQDIPEDDRYSFEDDNRRNRYGYNEDSGREERRKHNYSGRDNQYDSEDEDDIEINNDIHTSTLSTASLAAGVMGIITVFGGYTAILGIIFSVIGILTGKRGNAGNPSTLSIWAIRISKFALILCSFVTLLLIVFYIFTVVGDASSDLFEPVREFFDNLDITGFWENVKESVISLIEKI